MSSLTKCNYCSLRHWRRDAARWGKLITVEICRDGLLQPPGFDVYRHDVYSLPSLKNHIAWMWDISEHCVC